ncbi:MAG: cobalt ECF transporter T component CbiQ [Anaerolineae bacterium]
MHLIDQHAHHNRIRSLDPAYKVGLALTVLLLCLVFSKPVVGLLAVGWMYLLAVRWAGLSWRTFGRVVLAEGTFMLLTTIGVVLSVSLTDPTNIAPWALRVGPLWLSSSPASLYQGIMLVTRALGAASAMNFLALTTPLIDMLELFRRWHLPSILVDIMVIIYRFIFVLLDSLNTMYVAQDSRLGYQTSYWRAMNSAALLSSRLFIDAFQRSRRLQIALESRGYEGGDLQVLPSPYQSDPRIVWLGLIIASSLVLAGILA